MDWKERTNGRTNEMNERMDERLKWNGARWNEMKRIEKTEMIETTEMNEIHAMNETNEMEEIQHLNDMKIERKLTEMINSYFTKIIAFRA